MHAVTLSSPHTSAPFILNLCYSLFTID
jgi:hypothetical protein